MENPEISGSTSLFHKCPHDILRLIFEAAMTRDAQGFKTATIISHVSRYWREIALSTPSLWAYVSFSTFRSFDSTIELLERTRERVGACGLLLVIKYIPLDAVEGLQFFDLEQITNLQWLKLQFIGVLSPIGPSLSQPLNLSGTSLKKLDLIFKYNSTPDSEVQSWDLPSLFPNLQHLHIEAEILISIQFSNTYSTVQHLSLRGLLCSLPNLIKCFPNATVLEFDNTGDLYTHNKQLEMPHLRRFKLYESHHTYCLKSLSCPVLEEFWCDGISSRILPFIDRNRSIASIMVNISISSQIRELAGVAPQLQHLTVHGLGKDFYSPPPGQPLLFALLKTLTLCNLKFQSLGEFEALVRSRCLPVEHSKSELLEGCVPLEALKVVVMDKERLEDTMLAGSEFIKEARVWIEGDEAWDWSKGKKVCMSWRRN